uniref:Uncharacterized protein n=1 Tax=Anguilla anguilla TaxID=7936 RepID=A0A0E9TPL2_ANGAN
MPVCRAGPAVAVQPKMLHLN